VNFKAAIFDVDGVIIDSAYIHFLAWREAFREQKRPFTFSEFKKTIDGMPRWKGAAYIFPDLSEKQINLICLRKQHFFDIYIKKTRVKVFKSSIALIKRLKKKGVRLAMASSSRNARPLLQKINAFKLFDVDAEGAFVKKGKPHPDIFLKAARKLKTAPKECVVFEDAQNGIDAAKKAGMKCVAVSRDPKHKLKHADLTVTDLSKASKAKLNRLFK
jgi:beta-phosphoglucomutase